MRAAPAPLGRVLQRAKRALPGAILWALMCFLLWAGFAGLAAVKQYYPPISLRYDKPISGQAAYNARRYAVENTSETMFWPTYWREGSARLESEFVNVQADCLWYCGQGALVWPGELTRGTWPGAQDLGGCVLSEELAWELWGSLDVVGMEVEIEGSTRVVRGILKGGGKMALVPTDERSAGDGWQAVELDGGPQGATREQAETFATASGLGMPGSVLMGDGIGFVAWVLAALPVVILVGGVLAGVGRALLRHTAWRKVVALGLLAVLVLALPSLLGLLPGWLIPSQWSDFSFWAGLGEQLLDDLRGFLGTVPRLRDVEGKMWLLLQAAGGMLSLLWAVLLCARMNRGAGPGRKGQKAESAF